MLQYFDLKKSIAPTFGQAVGVRRGSGALRADARARPWRLELGTDTTLSSVFQAGADVAGIGIDEERIAFARYNVREAIQRCRRPGAVRCDRRR